jgi:SusD family
MKDKTMKTRNAGAHPAVSRLAHPFLVAGVAVALVGCNDPLTFTDPDIVLPGNLTSQEAIPTLVEGAVGDFALAYGGAPVGGGSTEGVVMASGLMSDEWMHSGTFPTRQEVDRRLIDIRNGTMNTLFANLQIARRSAEAAVSFIQANAEHPDALPDQARVLNLAGYTYLFFAENYCSGVPFSSVDANGEFVYGDPLTTPEMYQQAMDRFDQALAYPAVTAEQAYVASLGQGRALLDNGNYAAAAAAVAAVPTSFEFEIAASINTPREEDGVYNLNVVFERWSVADAEGGNGLRFRAPDGTNEDPRIPWTRTGGGTDVGFDRTTPQFDMLKYPGRDAPIPLAEGVEARLIEAEAALQAGNPTGMLSILNALRTAAGMNQLTDPGTANGRVDLLFAERAFWLYSTGHRLSDLRRLVRQYGRGSETVFPTGAYFKGGVYGPDVNFPVPFNEENNPNFDQCIDRSA